MQRKVSILACAGGQMDGGVLFGNVPQGQWRTWAEPDHLNRVALASRALLVQQGGRNILVLAGSGALLAPLARTCSCQPRARGLLEELASCGVGEADVHLVLLCHLQARLAADVRQAIDEGDQPRLLFPNARYLVGSQHWGRARRPHPRDRALFVAQLVNSLEASRRLELIQGGACEWLGPGWYLHVSDGYTPGQLIPQIALTGGPLVFAGDLVPGVHWLQLDVTSGHDRNAESIVEEKELLLDQLVASKGRLVFARDPDVAMVRVARDRQARYLAYDSHIRLRGLEA
ncbi:MBL fold metallo-hydrolase [Pseudomonas sp. NPDC089996]|uniref:MBL fold metallo-hydrolase n=1 Tax=Pseudomonas sp. NPDC089996 TaxID=3364474 RepID=UPI0037F1C9C0